MDTRYEQYKIKQGFGGVIGSDEVGRGCLAGPVVAAAVMFSSEYDSKKLGSWFGEVNDSKLLSAEKREELARLIKLHALAWGVGVVSEKVVDEINIHYASLSAMQKAVKKILKVVSSETSLENFSRDKKIFLAVDGKFKILNCDELEQDAVIDGDAKILSIAAASIVAKVYRDALMKKFAIQYPGYGFEQHKGYATFHHRTAIKKLGLTPLHRISFCKNYIK